MKQGVPYTIHDSAATFPHQYSSLDIPINRLLDEKRSPVLLGSHVRCLAEGAGKVGCRAVSDLLNYLLNLDARIGKQTLRLVQSGVGDVIRQVDACHLLEQTGQIGRVEEGQLRQSDQGDLVRIVEMLLDMLLDRGYNGIRPLFLFLVLLFKQQVGQLLQVGDGIKPRLMLLRVHQLVKPNGSRPLQHLPLVHVRQENQ